MSRVLRVLHTHILHAHLESVLVMSSSSNIITYNVQLYDIETSISRSPSWSNTISKCQKRMRCSDYIHKVSILPFLHAGARVNSPITNTTPHKHPLHQNPTPVTFSRCTTSRSAHKHRDHKAQHHKDSPRKCHNRDISRMPKTPRSTLKDRANNPHQKTSTHPQSPHPHSQNPTRQ